MRNVLLFIIRTFFYACQFHVPIYFLVMINGAAREWQNQLARGAKTKKAAKRVLSCLTCVTPERLELSTQ